jgi:hypothetical protein
LVCLFLVWSVSSLFLILGFLVWSVSSLFLVLWSVSSLVLVLGFLVWSVSSLFLVLGFLVWSVSSLVLVLGLFAPSLALVFYDISTSKLLRPSQTKCQVWQLPVRFTKIIFDTTYSRTNIFYRLLVNPGAHKVSSHVNIFAFTILYSQMSWLCPSRHTMFFPPWRPHLLQSALLRAAPATSRSVPHLPPYSLCPYKSNVL